MPPRLPGSDSTYWLYCVLVPEDGAGSRDALLAHLDDAGVMARSLWRPLHDQPPFAGAGRVGGEVSEGLFRRGLSLPCSTDLTDADQDRVVEAVLAFLEG